MEVRPSPLVLVAGLALILPVSGLPSIRPTLIESIEFNARIPDYIFTKASLR